MPDRERTDEGTYIETVTLEAIRDVFDDVRGPVITTSDVADALDCTTEAARQKLTRLYDRGEVDKRKTGRTVVYWRTGGDRITPDERAVDAHAQNARERNERRGESGAGHSAPSPGADTDDGHQGATDAAQESVESILRGLGLPGSGGKLEARIDAVREMYAHLRENAGDAVEKADLLALVDPDAVGYASETSFWNNCVKANKSQGRDTNALVALPGVEDWGGGEYRFTGTDDDATGGGVYDPTAEFEE